INSTEVHKMRKDGELLNVIHEVVIPAGTPVPSNAVPTHNFDLELDPFQNADVQVIENEQLLFVSAHTSAGKIAIAQYAIAEALRNSKRVIYTSPI
ncbi:hypothetical protein PMAYCL1PPCAC_05353, partial [Pristionchus mayeri]